MFAQLLDRWDLNTLNDILFYIQSNIYTQADTSTVATNAANAVVYHNSVRLEYVNATSLQLAGLPGTSAKITVYGEHVDCSTFPTMAPTDNLITATGADAGSAMGASTFYYIYVSNSLATTFPTDLRASTIAPTAGYLGTSGNALNWKLVGWVQTNSSSQFAFSDTQRLVCSKFNPRFLRCYVTESTSHTYTTTTWRKWNNADGTKLEFITHEDHLGLTVGVSAYISSNAAIGGYVGAGIDSTSALAGAVFPGIVSLASHTIGGGMGGSLNTILAAGYHYAHLLEYSSGSTATLDDGTISIGLFL